MKIIKSLFQRKISKKEVEVIERNLINELSIFDQNFEKFYNYNLSQVSNIYFSFKPKGISIMREFKNQEKYNSLRQKNNEIQNIEGVKFFNKKTQKFEDVKISFSSYLLKFIEYPNPERFHDILDINKIQIENFIMKSIKLQNPDKEIVEKILAKASKMDLNKLDLESCFEIEFNDKYYYTIIDFETGEYVAVDKTKNVYYLNHNSLEKIRKINDNVFNFLENFNGKKEELLKSLE